MFRHIDYLQFEAKPEKPDPAYAHKLQELIGGAVLGGMDPQQAIVPGGGPLLADSNGYPWNGRYIVASGNLLADFRANAAAETQGRVQTARLYNMTDDPGVRNMLKFNLARDTLHQNLWLEGHRGAPGRRPGDHGRAERAVRRGVRRARNLGVAPVGRHRGTRGQLGGGTAARRPA